MSQSHLYIGETCIASMISANETSDFMARVSSAVNRVNRVCRGGWPIGLEGELERSGPHIMNFLPPTLRHRLASRIVLPDDGQLPSPPPRPPSELAASWLWKKGALESLTLEDLRKCVRILGGSDLIRTDRGFTAPFVSGERVEFLVPQKIEQRVKLLFSILKEASIDDLTLLYVTYIDILIIHPFIDGNGRLARLLLQKALQDRFSLRAPVLPIGPILRSNPRQLIRSYHALYFDRNWMPICDLLTKSLERTAFEVEKKLGSDLDGF